MLSNWPIFEGGIGPHCRSSFLLDNEEEDLDFELLAQMMDEVEFDDNGLNDEAALAEGSPSASQELGAEAGGGGGDQGIAAPPQDRHNEPAHRGDFDEHMATLCRQQDWGYFRFAWKKVSIPSRPNGAIEANCPYHRLNVSSGCKKTVNLPSRSNADVGRVLLALKHWCNSAQHYQRQALHILPHKLDLSSTPPLDVVQMQLYSAEPPRPVKSDVELDAEVQFAQQAPQRQDQEQVGVGSPLSLLLYVVFISVCQLHSCKDSLTPAFPFCFCRMARAECQVTP